MSRLQMLKAPAIPRMEAPVQYPIPPELITEPMPERSIVLLQCTAQIIAGYLSGRPNLSTQEILPFIGQVHVALAELGDQDRPSADPAPEPQQPAVNPKRSIRDDHIICLEDGKKFKSLKRHIMTSYGLTPEAYRQKWNLPADYPMVAPAYAAQRSQLAKTMGLGKKH